MAKPPKRNNVDFWMFKAPIQLKQKLDEIRLERIKKGKDIKMQDYKRLGLAISRSNTLISDLIKADFIEDGDLK